MKARVVLILSLLLPALAAVQAQAAMTAHPQGLEKYGYPYVLTTVKFQPGRAMDVTVPDQVSKGIPPGYATFSIPQNAFTKPVTIRFLAAKNSYWDKQVPAKVKVIANFAYLITDTQTGAIVHKINNPIMYTLKDPMVRKGSVYWATTAHTPAKLINVNKASRISKGTLIHPTPVSFVGWIITTPKAELSMGSSGSMGSSSSSASTGASGSSASSGSSGWSGSGSNGGY